MFLSLMPDITRSSNLLHPDLPDKDLIIEPHQALSSACVMWKAGRIGNGMQSPPIGV